MLALIVGQASATTISNTATVDFQIGPTPGTTTSNTVALETVPAPSPAVIGFLRYAPGSPGSAPTPADGGSCQDSAGVFAPITPVTDSAGAVIDTMSPPIFDAASYQLGEAVFIKLVDANRNLDPAAREFIDLRVTTSTGDEEVLRLQETGMTTGIFVTALQSAAMPPAPTRFDCRLSVIQGATLQANYTDDSFPADKAQASAVVDPFGIVFDSSTGLPVDGATVTLVDAATGLPATVFGVDGTSTYPATVVSGATVTDSSGRAYAQPPGGYQFPSVAAGDYVLQVTPPGGYGAPSTVPLPVLQAVRDPAGNPYVVAQGSFGDSFTRPAGPGFRIDLPVDPVQSGLLLQKSASTTEVAAGDFLQYRLTLQNLNTVGAVADVRISDTLPLGMRYQAGSLRIADRPAADPAVSPDGRTLTMIVGTLAAAGQAEVSYVVQVGAGARAGEAVNRASATAGGGLASNVAEIAVRIRDPFFTSQFTIIGRVVEGECGTPWQDLAGVPDVRMLLDDGTYVPTDEDGQFHFEGVRPGTHVVQLDLDSLPPDLEAVPCIQNSRFAGRSFSQFVEAQGGSLWRADFYVRRRVAEVGIRLQATLVNERADGLLDYRVEVDGGQVWTKDLLATVQLPDGVSYSAGSTRIDGVDGADPQIADGFVTFRLGDPGVNWRRVIEFKGRAAGVAKGGGIKEHTLHAQFDSGEARLKPEAVAEADRLIAQLRDTSVKSIDVVGHTDSQRIAPAYRKVFRDNDALSQARAQSVATALADGLGLPPDQVRTAGKGPREPLASNDTPAGMARNRRVEVTVVNEEAPIIERMACPADGLVSKAVANFATQGQPGVRTPMVENRLACSDATMRTEDDSSRKSIAVTGPGAAHDADAAYQQAQMKRRAIPDDAEAAGANIDWLGNQAPGAAWLFPAPHHNPRAPTQRIAIKHAPNQTVVLKYKGQPVHPLNFDGVETNAAKTVSVSVWRGLPLGDGDNRFDADVLDERGATVTTLTRTVHYANTVAQAVLVPEESILVADGRHEPVIAVRLLDRAGRPVRAGVTGAFRVNPPYIPAQTVEAEQQRQLAGSDRFAPTYRIEGDDGIAYIELAPTTESGGVVLNFSFRQDERTARDQELRVWLEAKPRDWVMVGFAAGTVGYDTLKGNMQSLAGPGEEDGVYHDGQVSLYAKGRVLGKWLLTLAYDSDKPDGQQGRASLLSTIDPNQFYTLYGDGTGQLYDAASAEKLYLKLERDQFYALIGDYETGLTQTELSRYSRTLTGVKSEYHGDVVNVTGFAADTAQNFARDEIMGNGTSGLYRLTRGGIVINGEKIRIETRDRFRSEIIVASRELLRHIDYDIDYSAGTLIFRQPINSRDFDFNPIFIVAEYETVGTADKQLNAGGRIGAVFLDGKLSAGASFVRDESISGKSNLGGVDAKAQLTPDTELRIEGATSASQDAALNLDGSAYLAEIEHHSSSFDLLAYVRRLAPGFGVNQQNGVESGTFKAGVDAQARLSEHLAVRGQVYRQDNLVAGVTRDAANAEIEYHADLWGARAGALVAQDEASTGETAESRQATVGVNRSFFDQKLELTAQSDFSLGGKNDSVDFPTRYQLGAAYALSDDVRLVGTYEVTDGEVFDSATSRVGLEVVPWQGARLTSTLNQSDISEYGPRTFAVLGLTQSFLVGKRWSFDVSTDTSRTFDQSGEPPLVINDKHPIASGGVLGNGALTEDFFALTGGATYRSELWSWTGRAETRDGETSDRIGFSTGFLRQAQAGVAFAASAQAFQVDQASGSRGLLANASLSWAFRPLGRQWSVLDRLEYRHDELTNGTGLAGSGVFGTTSLTVAGDAKSRRLVNNLVLNRVARAWSAEDTQGNLFELNQRNQWSLYYGSKYVFDSFGGTDYSGYTDIAGLEWRYDITRRIDVGLRGSVLHSWNTENYEHSMGPVIGYSPFDNAWFSVGYNFSGFSDRDFDSAYYTAQGPFLTLRFKFDQSTLLPADAASARSTP
ncbi:MAG: OmpA family protein [Steroidobacteraceae bacterium]